MPHVKGFLLSAVFYHSDLITKLIRQASSWQLITSRTAFMAVPFKRVRVTGAQGRTIISLNQLCRYGNVLVLKFHFKYL